MRIVEEDFIMEPCSYNLFDLTFRKKVKDKETGEIKIKELRTCYGLTLSSCIYRIINFRLNTKFSGESKYLLEALEEIINLNKEVLKLCKEVPPEKFDTGD